MSQPLIVHLVHRFDTGGMENGMVTLFNHMDPARFRHAVVSWTAYGDFRTRIRAQEVEFHALQRRPGHDPGAYARLWRLLRRLKPAVLHTRNLAALEGQFVARLAGVRATVHGEHGRDVFDLHGRNRKYNLLRRAARPLVGEYVAVSRDLAHWLRQTVRVEPARIHQIYNGVDCDRFRPRTGARPAGLPAGFADEQSLVIGAVGRMAAVKDFPTLVETFLRIAPACPTARLVIVGEGEARAACQRRLADQGLARRAWLPGERQDIAELLRTFDVFVLPSLNEGISNTLLEAQATALPVIATAVGGNVELVTPGENGALVPVGDIEALAQALLLYLGAPDKRRQEGAAGRARVLARHSIAAMVADYAAVYERVLGRYH